MSHIFDTGLAKPHRTLLQQGAVALLSPLKRSNGGYLANVVPFGGCVRTWTDELGISELLITVEGHTPCIAVSTGDRQFETTGMTTGALQASSTCEVLLYYATANARSMQRGRQEIDAAGTADPKADPGLHVMMEHGLELMIGQYVSRLPTGTVKQLRIQSEGELVTHPTITVWLQTWRVQLLNITPDRGGGREWRTAGQLLESIGWRVTTSASEVDRPDDATLSTSIDFDTTNP